LSLLRRGARRLAGSRTLANMLLRIDVPPIDPDRRYFDLTTPVLVRLVAPRVTTSTRLLDMGTGAFAAIGLALWRRTGCQVVASDIDADLVEQARANVAANGAPIRVVRASFFDGIEEDFDCVTFNAPYVPTGRVGADGGAARYAVQADGGARGTDAIEDFLAAFEREARVGLAYLGINSLMVPRDAVTARIAERPGLRLEKTLRMPLLPVHVFAIRHADAPRTKTTSAPAAGGR